jgi:hypothetical protein
LLLLSLAFAQTSYHLTTEQGLATNQLTVLIKDRQNNMWFGSYNGLHKAEGTFIKVYNKNSTDSFSLSSNEMHGLFEDRLGFIWVGTTGGLDKLDPKTNIIQHITLKSAKRNDDWIGYINSVFQDNKDRIWVKTEVGIFVINYSTHTYFEILGNEKSGKGMPSTSLLYKSTVTTKEGIWMYTPEYLIFYDFKTEQFVHKYNNPQHKQIFELLEGDNAEIQSDLDIDSAKNLYFIFNSSTLIKYNVVTDRVDSFPFTFPNNAWRCCMSVATDYKGNVWIGFRYGGLLFFNNNTHLFTPVKYRDANSLIQSNYIYSLDEDYLKRMWVTTENGIFIINYYDSIVQQKYLSDKKGIARIEAPPALISQDNKGTIYIPFFAAGLFTYNVFTGKNKYFPSEKKGLNEYGLVYAGDKNRFYIGNKESLMPVDIAPGSIRQNALEPNKYSFLGAISGRVDWVFRYNENAIYFKKGNGNIYYYNGTGSIEKIESTGYAKQACISGDNKFLYLLSKNNDLVRRNLASLKMDSFSIRKKLQTLNFSLSNTRDIADDNNGNIWITSQNGLVKFNVQNETVTVYTTANGLLHDFSFTICVDSKNRLWVGSMAGVNLYDAQANTFLNVFAETPDKLSNFFGSSLEGKDGHIYFVFGNKLVNINPDAFLKQKIEERILKLNEVAVNGEKINLSTGILSSLSYKQNRIYVCFGLLEFVQPEKVNYYYKLDGLDKDWINLGNHSEITFNSLQPGNYTLNVRATDIYGNSVKEQIVLSFKIAPPFWKTWVFIILVAVLLGLILLGFVNWREKNIKAIAAEKLKVQQLNSDQFKSKLELEQIVNYFSSSLINNNTVDEVLWDVAKNLIGRLGFVDCMMYLWNEDKTKMTQRASYGAKGSAEEMDRLYFDVMPGQGIVGYVIDNKEPLLISDTSKDSRYREDDMLRLSEIAVPILYNNELLGVIDSEHPDKDFYTQQHLQLLTTIATLIGNKIKSIEAGQLLQQTRLEMYRMNDKLSKAKLETLRSQMNPHFIFNSLNAIQECIVTNKVDAAYTYLSAFSKLQRMVLNNSEKELIPLSSEIEMLELYLSLESLRFSKSFSYNINFNGVADTDEIMIPSLITQPLVENAIWHGLRNKEGEKTLDIAYEEKEGLIFITIDDNGIGREKAAAIKQQKIGSKQFASKGILILQQRLHVLSQQLKTEIRLVTTDKEDEVGNAAGTKVIISFTSNLESDQ